MAQSQTHASSVTHTVEPEESQQTTICIIRLETANKFVGTDWVSIMEEEEDAEGNEEASAATGIVAPSSEPAAGNPTAPSPGTSELHDQPPTLDAQVRQACMDDAQDLADEEGWFDEVESRRQEFSRATKANRWWLAQLPHNNVAPAPRHMERSLVPTACLGAWWQTLLDRKDDLDAKCFHRPYHGH